VLDAALRDRPDATAVIARSGELTYREFDAEADRAAAALWQLGVRPGHRVAATLPNDLDVVLAFHGAMRIGAIWAGIGEALAAAEKQQLLAACEPTIYLAAEAAVEAWREAMSSADAPPEFTVDVHAPAGIAFTSGTTGLPRGIVHSQHNLLLPGEVLVATRGWGPALRKGDCLPLTILNMQVLTTLLTAQAQGCAIIMDRRDSEGVAEWIERTHVTHWNGVPAQLHDMVTTKPVDPDRLASLREVWTGGGDCPESLRTRFAEMYGLPIRASYGLTEAPTVVALDPVGGETRPGARGRVLDHLWVQTRGRDGVMLPPESEGELCIAPRRDGAFANRYTPYLGLWQDGAVTEPPSLPIPTGDIGIVDREGWLYVLDRLKVLIVRGGANVYPAEVERVLLTVEGVAGAVVFGVPDERLGERVAALVEPQAGAEVSLDALRSACADSLADYKTPERWGVVTALPRNAMGKVVRLGLVELLDLAEIPAAAGGSPG
jgi:acyl-CoA synthetase (AMP-forming)/AMP-acid ligase II